MVGTAKNTTSVIISKMRAMAAASSMSPQRALELGAAPAVVDPEPEDEHDGTEATSVDLHAATSYDQLQLNSALRVSLDW